ncbi:MAG: SDR family oxidoreductase [Oscillospiraceae bacterium]|jgi:glucose 1-dehydrogenase|nr:SDR family oxidoreductase [Oscillospiraceae bacterium]
MSDLTGKRVLITGGGKGIGRGIALGFAERGAKVAIGCNANAGMAAETLKMLQEKTDAVLIQADVGTPEGCEKLVRETVAAFGGIDIFVNNAAIQTHHSFLESSEEILKGTLNVNLRAGYLLLGLCHPYLKESGEGRVIFVSSVHGKRATDFDVGYAVSKGGMEMLIRETAVQFAKDHITVNIIAPGAVQIENKTGNPRPMTRKHVPGQRYFPLYPLGRFGLPSDVAEMACYLAGKEAEFISGTTIRLDGCAMLL